MKKLLILATAYPYTAGILAIMWIGTAAMLKLDPNLPFDRTITLTCISSIVVAAIGFRK